MKFSYKKLWKLLIDKDMTKQDLCEAACLSSSTVAKLTKGENVSTADLSEQLCRDVVDSTEYIGDAIPIENLAVFDNIKF